MIRLVKVKVGRSKDFPKRRDMAWCERKPLKIVMAPKLEKEPVSVQRGVIAHELGHALLFLLWKCVHSEKHADLAAEVLFGRKIRYNRDNIQTFGPGKETRPASLPK